MNTSPRALALALVSLSITGCAVGPDDAEPTASAVESQPFVARPGSYDFRRVVVGRSALTEVTLVNTAEANADITAVRSIPPGPCVPPDPYVPPDPDAPAAAFRARAIAPCVRPGGTSELQVQFTPARVGEAGAQIAVDYLVRGAPYTLCVPVAGVGG